MKKFLHSTWEWVKPYLTVRMVPFLAVAWCITNGWAYSFVVIGPKLEIPWMTWCGGAWLSLLWFPFTIEKPITIAIAGVLYRIFYGEKFIKKPLTEAIE